MNDKEKLLRDHVKTRQDVFLERYPDTTLNGNGIIDINPCILESKMGCKTDGRGNLTRGCTDCRRDYWSQEVEQ